MNKKSQIKAGIILNYVNEILGNLIPLFYTPIMLTLLGQAEYGLYKLSGSITSYLSLISMGIGAAVTRYLIKADTEEGKEAEERMLGLFLRIFQVIAILAFAVGLLLTLNLHLWYSKSLSSDELQRMRVLVFLMTCNTALSFSMSPYVSAVSTHERFVFIQSMNIITSCVLPLLNLVVLWLGFASVGMAVASLSVSIVTRFAYYFYVRKGLQLKARFKGLPTSQIKEILVFSFWIFVANVVAQLYNATDTVMIGAVPALATAGVAVYNVGQVFNHMVFGLTTGVSSLLGPKTNRMVFSGASGQELTDLAIKVGRIQGCIIGLVVSGFIVFGKAFIHIYTKSTGDDYSAAYWVAVCMMVPNMIPLVQSVCLSIIVAQNKHRFRSLVYLGIAILNVIGTWFLMHTRLGIVGAALMTGIALIIGQGFAMNWYYSRKTNLEISRFWMELAEIYIVPAIMCLFGIPVARCFDFRSIPLFLLGVCTYAAVYLFADWKLIFNEYEKNLIRYPFVRWKYKRG